MLPLLDQQSGDDRSALASLISRLRAQVDATGAVAEQVQQIVEDVAREGDAAVVRYMRRWTDPAFDADRIRVSPEELAAAEAALDANFRRAAARAIDHVRGYQQHIKPADPAPVEIDGAQLGLRFSPIARVGLHVPGGRAAYPSSVIMLAVPAQVAGVKELAVVSPPPTARPGAAAADISPLVLGVAHMLGLETVYRIGGAQAVAALAFGTETVAPVDLVAGPGNAYTQQAKRQLFGRIGIDGFFGPSEVVVVADESARADWLAADLLAQAEHDPGCCFLISWSRTVLEKVQAAVAKQLPKRSRRDVIEKALAQWSAAVLVEDESAAAELADTLAAEHVTLALADPRRFLERVQNGGAFFLGDATPVASGDYYAGPSHCLPTGSTARYSSGLSVYTFLKRSSIETYPQGLDGPSAADIITLAQAEGLEAHAHSVRIRRD